MSATPTTESPAAEAARRRRERLLAKQEERLKYVSGETKTLEPTTPSTPVVAVTAAAVTPSSNGGDDGQVPELEVTDLKPNEATPTPTTPAPTEYKPRWEQKWEANVAQVQTKREMPDDILNRLDVTASLAVEAPRATAGDVTAVIKNMPPFKEPSMFDKLKLDSLLTSFTAVLLGYMSGISNGEFVQQNLWLPLGSFLLFALLVRIVLSVSLRRMKLVAPKSKRAASDSDSGIFSMVKKFLPPAVNEAIGSVMSAMGFVKDSYDDMMLFVFAHALACHFVMKAAGVEHKGKTLLVEMDAEL